MRGLGFILGAAAAALAAWPGGAGAALPGSPTRYCHVQHHLEGTTLTVTRTLDAKGALLSQEATSPALGHAVPYGVDVRILWLPGPASGLSREPVLALNFTLEGLRRMPAGSRVRLLDGAAGVEPVREFEKGWDKSFRTPLAPLLERHRDRTALRFELTTPGFDSQAGQVRARGRIDLALARRAAAAFPAIDRELDALQADHLRKCSTSLDPGAPGPTADEYFVCPVNERSDHGDFHADTGRLIWTYRLGRGFSLHLDFHFEEERGAAFVASGFDAFESSHWLRPHVASGRVDPGRAGLRVALTAGSERYELIMDRSRAARFDWRRLRALEAAGGPITISVRRANGRLVVEERLPAGLADGTERRLRSLYAQVIEKRKDFAVRCERAPEIFVT